MHRFNAFNLVLYFLETVVICYAVQKLAQSL